MPHISVKLREGYSRARKARLSDAPAFENDPDTHRRLTAHFPKD